MKQVHANDKAPFSLPKLPYDKTALEPELTAETFDYHYGKHHQKYVSTLNDLLEGSDFHDQTLIDIIKNTAGKEKYSAIFNNAAQIWNHTFYWHCMKPKGGGKPSGSLAEKINADFGSYDKFREEFLKAGATQFGSGWAWLVLKSGKLEVMKTANADLPMAHGVDALLTADVWEHAYYIDYRNKRPDYLEIFLDKLVNWEFVENNLNMLMS